jgi:hypothetical protein
MSDFNVRSDSINVEQIMEQIRARIREKRGVDYTEQQIRELAAVKLEKFIDPRGVRSDLLEQFRKAKAAQPAPPNYAFEDQTIYETHRGLLRAIRRLLQPILKLFFNPNPIIQALHIQSELNTMNAARRGLDELSFEVLHNLVVETTRLGIDVKNLRMRVESLASRLEFNERRARALESVVVYKPREEGEKPVEEAEGAAPRKPPSSPVEPGAGPGASPEGPGQRSRRRRRRRGRRGGASAAALMAGTTPGEGQRPTAAVEAGETDSTSAPDAETARAVSAPHDTTTESMEQAIAAESIPTEPPRPPAGFGSDSDQ